MRFSLSLIRWGIRIELRGALNFLSFPWPDELGSPFDATNLNSFHSKQAGSKCPLRRMELELQSQFLFFFYLLAEECVCVSTALSFFQLYKLETGTRNYFLPSPCLTGVNL